MAADRDHATNSVATLRAELAAIRPRLAKVESRLADAHSINELLDAAHRKVMAERDEARALVRELYALQAETLFYQMENGPRVMGLAWEFLKALDREAS
jgi:hypothetical protein